MDRQHIVDEIRRTAADNRGVPLGRTAFRQATGIRPADWEGRFWARWNDALSEAGLSPNRFNAAFDKTSLLEQYIGLVRRLGRVPVNNELKMAARSDGLPDPKTFTSHFGPKATLIATARAYCLERPGYDDVIALLGQPPAAQSGDDRNVRRREVETAIGFVYLVKSGRHYKIGRSNSASRREYEIALHMPERASKVHEIRTDDPAGIEVYWHRRFADRRKNGEWFELTAADVAAFRRRSFM